ncbi:MAG: YbhB/YbcL family Raf kinase inhibitor-like protein [Rhodocyclaceae bacterium]|nr:MAG: YbhB/YbcL family Raf kinase inhibitor-like protein [Rhodocyclaceae bacterium]
MKTKFLVLALLVFPLFAHAENFVLDSPDVGPKAPIGNKYVFKGFGCEGDNVSPALVWKGAPRGTKSFALTVYDPDAPTGSGWWHWVAINIPADVSALPQGAGDPAAGKMPQGVLQTRTDFGQPGWGGPCPPVGDKPHRYIFTVHALGVEKLDVPESAPAAMVGYMINANRIAKTSFTARYGRK